MSTHPFVNPFLFNTWDHLAKCFLSRGMMEGNQAQVTKCLSECHLKENQEKTHILPCLGVGLEKQILWLQSHVSTVQSHLQAYSTESLKGDHITVAAKTKAPATCVSNRDTTEIRGGHATAAKLPVAEKYIMMWENYFSISSGKKTPVRSRF